MAVYSYAQDLIPVSEKAAEDNAMNLKQAEKFYKETLKTFKSKAETKEQIDDCLNILKECLNDMKRAKTKAKSNPLDGGRIKYALKSLIPFNSIWRVVKRNDWQAMYTVGVSTIEYLSTAVLSVSAWDAGKQLGNAINSGDAGAIGAASGRVTDVINAGNAIGYAAQGARIVIRFATYTKMLDQQIKDTEEAIDYLEKKKKELK